MNTSRKFQVNIFPSRGEPSVIGSNPANWEISMYRECDVCGGKYCVPGNYSETRKNLLDAGLEPCALCVPSLRYGKPVSNCPYRK